VINNIDALILNQQDTTLEFVKQVYTLLTERQLMPPIKIYETLQQANPGEGNNYNADGDRGGAMDYFGSNDDGAASKRQDDNASAVGGSIDGGKGSPQKSLAIKGPPKIIAEKLEIEDYKGVKVTDINVRPINASVAHIRAKQEMSSIHSGREMEGS